MYRVDLIYFISCWWYCVNRIRVMYLKNIMKINMVSVWAFMFIHFSEQSAQGKVYRNIINNKTANFTEIGLRIGFKIDEHDVTTEDGYILKLFHIPGDVSRPVLLMHGMFDSADTFIIRENNSLAAALANAGYDVWIGNVRGNRYSRRHISLDPDTDIKFWDYSFHEFGYYDLPAIIDYILNKTGQKTLSAAGHSQGNTIFYVLGSKRPEYNEKLKVMVALSPICFLSNLKNVISNLLNFSPSLFDIFTLIGDQELFGDETPITRILRGICGCKKNYILCACWGLFPLAGSDPKELEQDFFTTLVNYFPTGTSIKNGIHVKQVGTRKSFSEFDYGLKNMDIYNSTGPPDYDLNKITMNVVLLAGRNDELSTLADIELLRIRLPNVEYILLKRKKFNHMDAVWGRNMDKYLFPYIFDVLEKY